MANEIPTRQHDLLLAIYQDVAEIKAAQKQVADHELRIRELEIVRWRSAWITGLLSAAISSVLVAVIVRAVSL
jgi:hypothetical protein